MIFEDQLAALEAIPRSVGTQGRRSTSRCWSTASPPSASRASPSTSPTASFATDKRKFIVADTPGHEQYTRNMVTGASTADLAVILIDARKGVLTQTRRHSFLAHRWSASATSCWPSTRWIWSITIRPVFDRSSPTIASSRIRSASTPFVAIPISGLKGDNITTKSDATPWYRGPTLLDYLETVESTRPRMIAPLRMPVQWVNRPNLDFRGFAGQIASGTVKQGERCASCLRQRESHRRAHRHDGRRSRRGVAGQSVTLTLADEIDISRGDVIAAADDRPEVADQFEATIVWMADEPMLPGRPYWLKIGTTQVSATITERSTRSTSTARAPRGQEARAQRDRRLQHRLDQAIAFEPYTDCRETWAVHPDRPLTMRRSARA
jgi:bifunctional enzyme CysN/CysC